MGGLVGHDTGDVLPRLRRRRGGVQEQDALAVGNGTPVLHRARRKVLERDVVEFRERIGDPIVLVEVVQDPGRFLQCPAAVGDPIGEGPHADFRSGAGFSFDRRKGTDDEGEEV